MSQPPFLKWQCASCGEIYDEALGLPHEGIPAGTRFSDLPGDWICPACGANKADYHLMSD